MTKTSLSVILALAVTLLPALAEDWTVNGKTYHNVKVTKVEPDRVHFTADDGLGSFAIADLTPELQKRFNYDPKAAAQASQQKAAAQAKAEAEIAKDAAVNNPVVPPQHPQIPTIRIASFRC